MHVPFIAVEGPIGAGKTSLSKEISDYLEFNLLKEIVDENPYLNKFYEDIQEWSFQTEMFFLCNRYKQIDDTHKKYIELKKPVVSDYHILKNLIFARRTLKHQDYEKYEQIYDILTKDMVMPNFIIYIHASIDTLLHRINKRGREFEKNMDPQYLIQLSLDYENYFQTFIQHHPTIPVLRINGDELDFVNNPMDKEFVMKQVLNLLNLKK